MLCEVGQAQAAMRASKSSELGGMVAEKDLDPSLTQDHFQSPLAVSALCPMMGGVPSVQLEVSGRYEPVEDIVWGFFEDIFGKPV